MPGRKNAAASPAAAFWISVLSVAIAVLLGALIVAGVLQGVGREELLRREGDVLEQLAWVVAAAAAGALLLRQAVVEHRHEKLAVALQADNGKLPQCHKSPPGVLAHGQLTAKALAHTCRNLADVTVTAAVFAALYQLCIQDDGVHSLFDR